MTNDYILEFQHITKGFFGVPVLKDISFGLRRGQVIGLIGENGAGKSTLMNLVGGVVFPDGGQMMLNQKPYTPHNPAAATQAGIAFIHQELNLFTNLSIAENMFIDSFPRLSWVPLLNKKLMRDRARELLAAVDLEVSPDTLVEKLSPGERQLVEIAKALSFDAQLIIFDEPTTSLTARETERLFRLMNRLRDGGKSMVYISHILPDVLALVDQIAVLRDGELVGVDEKSNFTIDRMISMMVGRSIEQLYPERTAQPSAETALQVSGLSQPGIIEDINFSLHKGEILGVFGLMGSGRSEMARILFGLDTFERGQILVNGQPHHKPSPYGSIDTGMAFVTEDRRGEGLLMDISIAENIGLVSLRDYATPTVKLINQSRLYQAVGEMGQSLKIKSANLEKQPVKSLSGGNQQKAVIGKWLMNHPAVFIIDEPTRGVDVGAKYEIYSIINDLAARGTGVLFISSEIEELTGVCDRILVMSNGEIQANFTRPEFNQERILRAAFREENGGS
jgi:ABC-type sugar transport system ATPase subunit